MYIKVFPHGKGPGAGPVNYLIRMDYPNREELPPLVLRGDPDITKMLIDAQSRVWKFTAGVCSWAKEDKVTPEQEQKLMDDFEKLAFADMEPDQYNILWVRHSHANHHELHFVIPRVELSTGKAFNAFPPGWQKDFDVLRDLYNYREDWARPDDPARARFCTPDHADLHQARLKRWGVDIAKDERGEAKNAIHSYLRQQIENGLVKDRNGVIEQLEDAGLEINRTGKDYITIKDTNSGAKLRLKGGIYRNDWQLGPANGQNQQQNQAGYPGNGSDNRQRIGELSRKLEQCLAKRAGYNQQRYCQKDEASARTDKHPNENTEHQLRQTLADKRPESGEHSARNLPGKLEHYVFGRSTSAESAPTNQQLKPAKTAASPGRESAERRELGYQSAISAGRPLHRLAPEITNQNRLDNGRPTGHKTGVAFDRTENDSIGMLEQDGRRNQTNLHGDATANQGLGSASSRIRTELAEFNKTIQQLETAYQGFEQYHAKQVELVKQREKSNSRNFEM